MVGSVSAARAGGRGPVITRIDSATARAAAAALRGALAVIAPVIALALGAVVQTTHAQTAPGRPATDETLSAPPAFDADNPPRTPPTPAVQEVNVPAGEPTVDGPAEQEVRIVRRDDAEVTEFRHGGVLRAIKVKPDVGPVYYLVDTDGDGDLETRTEGPRAGLAIPMWIIARW